MKSIFKTFSIAILSAILSLFVYDQYIQDANKNYTNYSGSPTLIPANYSVNNTLVPAERTDFTNAAEKTIDAVVHVKNTSKSNSKLPSFYRYFNQDEELPDRIGTGSGVIVSPDGYIITNNHVIENNNEIENSVEYDALKKEVLSRM